MKFSSLALTTSLVSIVSSAYIPSEPWSTLTPDKAAPSGALTDYATEFGIAVLPITTGSLAPTSTAIAKRQVISQIGDGQIQATTSTAKATSTKAAVSQIGDGQIQATTSTAKATSTKAAVSQIGDGQIQATTSTAKATSTKAAVSQIGDGQIQATTSTAKATSTKAAVSQIGDGQIQATTATTSTKTGVSQISDGQIQATTATTATKSGVSQISDGQAQATTAAGDSDTLDLAVSCKVEGSLVLKLNDSILTDSSGRIGSIVANRQFQFDGPPPQAGAIYAAGWSITEDGYLAIGDNDVFYQCLSGTFYNLYDQSIGAQCAPIHLEVVGLVDC